MKQDALAEKSPNVSVVTRRIVRERAVELAVINGRSAQDVWRSDWEQARQELSGNVEPAANEATLEATAELQRRNPVSGTTGRKVQASSGVEGDQAVANDNESLADEGAAGAELDQARLVTGLTAPGKGVIPPIITDPTADQPSEISGKARGSPSAMLYSLIAAQPFFKGLNTRQLKLLAESALEMQFEKDQVVFKEGSPANRFYLILSGKVVLESENADHNMISIQTLGPGEDLGWAWLFPPYSVHLNARALEPTRTIFFYGTRLREQCEDDHELGYQLLQRVAQVATQCLRITQQRLMELADPRNQQE